MMRKRTDMAEKASKSVNLFMVENLSTDIDLLDMGVIGDTN